MGWQGYRQVWMGGRFRVRFRFRSGVVRLRLGEARLGDVRLVRFGLG